MPKILMINPFINLMSSILVLDLMARLASSVSIPTQLAKFKLSELQIFQLLLGVIFPGQQLIFIAVMSAISEISTSEKAATIVGRDWILPQSV